MFLVECGKQEMGIDCLVVNPADIPSTQKDNVYKTDARDARGIGQALSRGQLKSIFVPHPEQEADRQLVRQRKKLWADLLFSALQHPRNFSVQFGTVRFVNRPF